MVSGLSCIPAQIADPNGSQFCSHSSPESAIPMALQKHRENLDIPLGLQGTEAISSSLQLDTSDTKFYSLSLELLEGEPQVFPCPFLFAPSNSYIEGLIPIVIMFGDTAFRR